MVPSFEHCFFQFLKKKCTTFYGSLFWGLLEKQTEGYSNSYHARHKFAIGTNQRIVKELILSSTRFEPTDTAELQQNAAAQTNTPPRRVKSVRIRKKYDQSEIKVEGEK